MQRRTRADQRLPRGGDRRARLLWAAGAAALLAALSPLRAGGGDEVVVVYNRRFAPDSQLVALHYAEKRSVPTNQIVGLSLPQGENMTRAEYREQLQAPLIHELESRGLIRFQAEPAPANDAWPAETLRRPVWAKVRYLVLCYGVPLRIVAEPNLVEPGTDKLRSELRRNEACVDSELTCLPRYAFRFVLAGPAANPAYAATNASSLHPTNGVFLVTRLDGPTMAVAFGLVDKAMEAEARGLWGRAYFDTRGLTNGPYLQGDEWIRNSALIARRAGFETLVDTQAVTLPPSFPMSQIGLYAGWYDGHVSGPFARPKVEFMPGAIAYHLHSFSASTLRAADQAWAGPLLAKGATATLGCVNEPYLDGTPDLAVFFSRLLFGRFTFGEAAGAAQIALSWQTTVVGDPLYSPMPSDPRGLHEKLRASDDPFLEWSHLRVVNLNLVTGMPPEELIAYLNSEPYTQRSAVLLQKLADLHLSLGHLDDAVSNYRKALRRQPSPQQKVQLQLTLAQWLALMERDAEALALYEELLDEKEDDPDPLGVCQKGLPVARRSYDTRLIRKFEAEIERLTPPPPTATNAPAPSPPAQPGRTNSAR